VLVVVLHPHFTLPGGAGKFVLEVGSRLADRGFRVLVVCIRANPDIVGPFRGKIEFREIGGPLSSSLLFWLTFPLRCANVWGALPREPFVLFPQVFPANWWGFLYKIAHPAVPLVWMCQEPSAFIHSRAWLLALPGGLSKWFARLLNPLLKMLDVRLARRADRVFANSLATKQAACRVYGYDPDRVLLCYPGVDTAVFRADAAVARRDQVVTVGRLTRFKNVDLIIRAVHLLNKTRSRGVTLKIVGRGEAEQSLRRLVRDLGLDREVVFCGSLGGGDLVRTLQESKALVLASVDEPFGIVAVEAMACGTPCVVERSGGPAETVLDGETGFHVAGPDPAAYAEKVRVLLDDEQAFRAMSARAVQRAGRYRWESAADELAACFAEILKK
jgi:glycosyltransferase involved in cell wall biosynthesis